MSKIKIDNMKKIIEENEHCFFNHFRCGYFYYIFFFDGKEYTFPIPMDGISDCTLNFKEKTVSLLGYLRNAIRNNNLLWKEL